MRATGTTSQNSGLSGVCKSGMAVGVAIIYLGLAVGSGLDRLTAARPELVDAVPQLFASEALRVAGTQALSRNDGSSLVAIGKHAIDDAPTDPQSAAILGAGLLLQENQTRADQAFLVAGKLGWRIPITQSYWLSKALAVSDYNRAALRLDALLRQEPRLVAERQLIDPMERNPAGRVALVQRLALKPEWLPNYVMDVASSPADVILQRSDVLEEAAHQGLVLGCPTITPIVTRLVELKLSNQARRLAVEHCQASEGRPAGAVQNR